MASESTNLYRSKSRGLASSIFLQLVEELFLGVHERDHAFIDGRLWRSASSVTESMASMILE